MATPSAGESSARVTSTRRALPPSNCKQADQRPYRHRLFDQGGEELRGRDRHVDAPTSR